MNLFKIKEDVGYIHVWGLSKQKSKEFKGVRYDYATPKTPPTMAYICGLYINEEYRGKGHGKELLRRAYDSARKLGYTKIYLTCENHNIPYYQKQGFEMAKEKINPFYGYNHMVKEL